MFEFKLQTSKLYQQLRRSKQAENLLTVFYFNTE